MTDNNQSNPKKPKKSLWKLFDELTPGISYKVVVLLIALGILSYIYRWIEWHF
ncbi:MAG: hypothetical protein K0S29_968 [Gammaproteobacteria bacterium]|jgi:hypothetical protein|nr:hypothetical protein [Gammaproteobacteria bacterium]